jgi:peptidyl-prolyl cis-trans isomerase A (cyclophilin A)
MRLSRLLFTPPLALALAASSGAQTAKPAEELPDAPEATAAVLLHPNGPSVVMDTSMGRITCQFYEKQAPKAVANFIGLATGKLDWTDPGTKKKQHNKPYYDGTTFHRVIPEFMIQGGDPTGTGMGDPGYSFADEFDPNLNFDVPGKLAMANSGPNTNGSQFFITEAAVDSLNQHYTLFGQCDTASVEVVKAIARVPRDANDKPNEPVLLKKVTIVQEGQQAPPLPGAGTAKALKLSSREAESLCMCGEAGPIYPPKAKAAGIQGTVVLHAVIDKTGKIADLQAISGPNELQQAAQDAVKRWKYRPYMKDGEPVEVETTINVIFTIAKK